MNYNAQLKAWAVDRAIETLKARALPFEAIDVIAVATQYCAFTADPVPEQTLEDCANKEAA